MLLCLAGGAGLPGLEAQKLWVRVGAGAERQDFSWSIAGNSAGRDPNVYSELKWRGISGPAGRIDLLWKPGGRWRIMAGGGRVFARSGSMTDTDYGLDNRFDPLYHQQFKVTAGYSYSGGAAAGYCLFCGDRFELTPFIGYGYEEQYFPVTDPGGPYDGLNSSYAAKWFGPLVKANGTWQLSGRWQVVMDASYHQVRYHATADWNEIAGFAHPVSFRHTADGYGIEGEMGVRYGASSRIGVRATVGYFDWETGTGIDQLYLSTGGGDQTQLNGVLRRGWRAMLGMEIGVF